MVGNKMAISGRTKYQIIVHICIEKTSSCNTEYIDKLCTESQYLCHLKRNCFGIDNNMERSDSSNICFNLL